MAIYHMTVKNGSRTKGQSAIAASAYRSGTKMLDSETGLISDYTRKSGVVFSEISLCKNAPTEYANRETLWNAVHKVEKSKNARLWREIEVALPKELNREEQIQAVREYVSKLTAVGMCADWSLHDKGDGNPHAHIMLTTRSITEQGTWAPKSRKVYDYDENGEKIYQRTDSHGRRQYKSHKEEYNNWNSSDRVEEWRAEWASVCNKYLSAEEKIDHRSYERQGKEQIPTVHEGFVARQVERAGRTSDRCEMNRNIARQNNLLAKVVQELVQIGHEIQRISAEKGSTVSAGKQRIADLLSRRNRTANIDSGGLAGRERTVPDRKTDTAIETARVTISKSRIVISKSETTTESTESDREKRELERERLAAEERRKADERSRREMERSRRLRDESLRANQQKQRKSKERDFGR